MNTQEIRSFQPLPTRSDSAVADRPRSDVFTRKPVKPAVHRLGVDVTRLTRPALHKVSFETVVNVLFWTVELYVLGFLLKLFLA